jgi:TRAP-type C4-dicarboxylate transport system substrate-binding protein
VRTRKLRTTVVSLLAVIALIASACGDADEADPVATDDDTEDTDTDTEEPADDTEVTLTLANFNQEHFAETIAINRWLDAIEERSDGRITFERFHGETLCEGAEIVDCVLDGRADVGFTIPGYTPDRFPIAEIMGLPFQTVNGEAAMEAWSRLEAEVPEVAAEAQDLGLKTIGYTMADRAIIGSQEPMTSIDDLSGQSIRTVGPGSELAVEAVGGNPVSMPASDMYEGMQRGVIDVWLNNIVGLIAINMYEVSEYVYDPGFGLYTLVSVWMSQDVFDDLPEDLQQIIDDVTDEWVGVGGTAYEGYAEGYNDLCQEFLDDHADQLTAWEQWPQEEVDRWEEALGDAAVDFWIESAQERGVENPEEVLETWRELLAEAEDASSFVSPIEDCMDQVG